MANYTPQKFCLGIVWRQTGGRPPWPSDRTSSGWIVPILLGGIDAPASKCCQWWDNI